MKTNSSAKKRFTVTGSGKIMRKKAFKNHILTKKTNKQKKRLGKKVQVTDADLFNVKKMLVLN